MSAAIQARSDALPAKTGQDDLVTRLSIFCILAYIVIYAFESPVRYVLYATGLSTLILLRDGLLIGPLALIFLRDFMRGQVHPAIWIFAIFITIGFAVGYINFGVVSAPALGAKMLLGTLFGIIAGAPLIDTTKRVSHIFLALWLMTVIGVVLEKYVVTFPWVGLHAMVGNVDVEISRDWQITDAVDKRVGGFTRVSISAAGLMPLLALVAIWRIKSFILRNAIMLVTVGAVFLTTQKGALLAVALVWVVTMVPRASRVPMLVAGTILALIGDAMIPILTSGMTLSPGSGGSYSSSSFVDRIMITWPDTWDWIARREIFPFGVGLGGIGEAQRFVSSAAFHYPDNLWLFLLSSFGWVTVAFFAIIVVAAIRGLAQPPAAASCALSVLMFILLYGSVVSIIEDQMEALFLGAAIGTLLTPRLNAAAKWHSPELSPAR